MKLSAVAFSAAAKGYLFEVFTCKRRRHSVLPHPQHPELRLAVQQRHCGHFVLNTRSVNGGARSIIALSACAATLRQSAGRDSSRQAGAYRCTGGNFCCMQCFGVVPILHWRRPIRCAVWLCLQL